MQLLWNTSLGGRYSVRVTLPPVRILLLENFWSKNYHRYSCFIQRRKKTNEQTMMDVISEVQTEYCDAKVSMNLHIFYRKDIIKLWYNKNRENIIFENMLGKWVLPHLIISSENGINTNIHVMQWWLKSKWLSRHYVSERSSAETEQSLWCIFNRHIIRL